MKTAKKPARKKAKKSAKAGPQYGKFEGLEEGKKRAIRALSDLRETVPRTDGFVLMTARKKQLSGSKYELEVEQVDSIENGVALNLVVEYVKHLNPPRVLLADAISKILINAGI